jgi:predicted ATP-binding protein involved in virulence
MYLKEVNIQNFRGIESCQLHFHDKMNLIIGENGVGKTSILEAIAVGLGGVICDLDGVSKKNLSHEDFRKEYKKVGDGSYTQKTCLPLAIGCKAVLGDSEYEWERTKDTQKSIVPVMQSRQIAKIATKLVDMEDSLLPILSYQSASRIWTQTKEAKADAGKETMRLRGYADSLTASLGKKQILAWCAKMEQIAWQKERAIGEYEGVKTAVSQFMTIMEGNQECVLYYDKQSEDIFYVKNGNAESISSLSAGYQSIVWMAFDVAYRMALLNPHLRENIRETPGIVLIDEPDAHLHPEWQWLLTKALRTVFPNIQLIIASHSPIILASVREGEIIDVSDSNDISYEEPAYGLDINDTLHQIQDSKGVPAEIAELQKKFDSAMDQEDMAAAEEAVVAIEAAVGDRPIAVAARTEFELETAWRK